MEKRKRVQLDNFGPSKTKQSFKDEVDINNIVKQFNKTGQLPPVRFNNPGQSMDLSSAVDFHTAMNVVRSSERVFNALSAKVRSRFDNQPEKFLDFMGDPKNVDEAIELGLVSKKPVAPPSRMILVDEKGVPVPQAVQVTQPSGK